MTDVARHHWFPPTPDLAAPGIRPLRPPAHVRPMRGSAPDLPRPPLSASVNRWLALYLRAHL